MSYLYYSEEVELIIAQIVEEQAKPFEKSLQHFQSLPNNKKVEEVYIKTILPVYQVLEILYKENKINTEQYHQRLTSLLRLCELLEKQ